MRHPNNDLYSDLSALADRAGAMRVAARFPASARNSFYYGDRPQWQSVLRGINLLRRCSLLLQLAGRGVVLPGYAEYRPGLPEGYAFPAALGSAEGVGRAFVEGVLGPSGISYSEFDSLLCPVRIPGGTNVVISSFEGKAESLIASVAKAYGRAPALVRSKPGASSPGIKEALAGAVDLSGVAYSQDLLALVAECASAEMSAGPARNKKARGKKRK